jgi:excisionase family DNA binding protein
MSEVKILSAGPDTVLVNFKFAGEDGKPNGERLPEEVATQLDEWQARARRDHDVVPTDLTFSYRLAEQTYEQTLFMRPHGSGIWSWLLYCDDLKLALSHGSMNGGLFCQVRFSSHLLWSLGAVSAMRVVESLLADFIGTLIYQQMSEVHLCVDLQGFDFSSCDWLHCFVSRVVRIRERPDVPTEQEQEGGLSPAQVKQVEERIVEHKQEGVAQPLVETNHRRIATLDFGSHGSNISAQIYNKSAEIKKHRKEWFEVLWTPHGYDPSLAVWRVEFRFRRKFLAAYDLNDAFSVLCDLGKLWAYATQDWLRMVETDGHDSNISRRPTHPVWEVIQEAYPVAAPVEAQDDYQTRKTYLLQEKPLQMLEQAALLSVEASVQDDMKLTEEELMLVEQSQLGRSLPRLALGVVFLTGLLEKRIQTALLENVLAVRSSFQDVPVEVIREMAQDALSSLSVEQEQQLVSHLAPQPLPEVQGVLIKRVRRMAKKQACIAALAGYTRSAVALAGDELCGRARPGDESTAQPDLLASLVWVCGKSGSCMVSSRRLISMNSVSSMVSISRIPIGRKSCSTWTSSNIKRKRLVVRLVLMRLRRCFMSKEGYQISLLNIPQVASVLGLSRTKVYALIATEGLPTVRFGRVLRVRPAALEQWIIQREQRLSA